MLATIRKVLAYLDWIMLVLFIVVFGIYLIPKTMIGGIAAIICGGAMLLIMFEESSKSYSPQRRISAGNPLGNPLVDIALFVYGLQEFTEAPEIHWLYLTGLLMVGVDLILWTVKQIELFRQKKH